MQTKLLKRQLFEKAVSKFMTMQGIQFETMNESVFQKVV